MNILLHLIPKVKVAYVLEDYTIRQALEKMEYHRYSSIPILDHEGYYKGTLSEGDLLWYLKDVGNYSVREAETTLISDIPKKRVYQEAYSTNSMSDLVDISINQNFIPVLDDRELFIGIVTRKDIIKYLDQKGEKK